MSGRPTGSIIDINGTSPQITPIPQLQYGRHWGNAAVLADGRVLVSGGSAVNDDDIGVAYMPEIFDPATNTWSLGATATRMRLDHSSCVTTRPGLHRHHAGITWCHACRSAG
jgi:Kelch motif protein